MLEKDFYEIAIIGNWEPSKHMQGCEQADVLSWFPYCRSTSHFRTIMQSSTVLGRGALRFSSSLGRALSQSFLSP